jgi:gag-polypeptide of LTR copia-type
MELTTTSNTTPTGNASPGNAPAPDNNSPDPTLSGSSSNTAKTVGSHNIKITERTFCVESWPNGLVLDLEKFNWREWCQRATILVRMQGFTRWLDGSLKCPDEQQYPEEHFAWQHNDSELCGFLLDFISPADLSLVEDLPTGHEIFETLRRRHEKRGPIAQAVLLEKILNVRFDSSTRVSETVTKLKNYITAMGRVDDDNLLTLALLNALRDDRRFRHLFIAIQTMSTAPGFCSKSVVKLIEDEEWLAQRHTKQSVPSRPSTLDPPVAFPVANMRRPKPPCSNCGRLNHSSDFCIAPGGRMAGRSIDDARIAQRAASGKLPCAPWAMGKYK